MPGPLISERWSGKLLSKQPPWTAQREFDVVGYADTEAAVRLTLPREGDQHPDSAFMRCTGSRIKEKKGPAGWVGQSNYRYVGPGDKTSETGDPLNEPQRWRFDPVVLTELVNYDLDGLPIKNSANDFFDPPARKITIYQLTIYRNEPYFDTSKAITFNNSVNDSAMTIARAPVDAQHMYCEFIYPDEQSVGCDYVRVFYRFYVVFGNALGPLPFQHRFVDAGRNGWYGTTPFKKGRFTILEGTNGNVGVETPVLLDLTGKPLTIENNVKVADGQTPVVLAAGAGVPRLPGFYAKTGDTINGISIAAKNDAVPNRLYNEIFYRAANVLNFANLGLS